MTIPTEVAAALAEMRELKVPNWPAGRILGDLADRLESALTKAEAVATADTLCDIGELLRTQDNRITANPIFVVEQKREYITDPDYYSCLVKWVDDEGVETKPRAKGARKFYVHTVWEFVTACFTEQGCKDYLRINGHNLSETRIYVHGGFRNAEWERIRAVLMAKPAAEPAASVPDGWLLGWARAAEIEKTQRHRSKREGSAIAVFVHAEKNETYSVPVYAPPTNQEGAAP